MSHAHLDRLASGGPGCSVTGAPSRWWRSAQAASARSEAQHDGDGGWPTVGATQGGADSRAASLRKHRQALSIAARGRRAASARARARSKRAPGARRGATRLRRGATGGAPGAAQVPPGQQRRGLGGVLLLLGRQRGLHRGASGAATRRATLASNQVAPSARNPAAAHIARPQARCSSAVPPPRIEGGSGRAIRAAAPIQAYCAPR